MFALLVNIQARKTLPSTDIFQHETFWGDLEKMAEILWRAKKVPVLIKGGHLKGKKVEDLFFDGISKTWFVFQRMVKKNIRGTGCALSAVIACFCAEGFPLTEAVRQGRITMQNRIQSHP